VATFVHAEQLRLRDGVAVPVECPAAEKGAEAFMADNDSRIVFFDRREALAQRLWRAAELQAAEVEARIAAGPRPAAETERDAKTLSVLARTLRELSAADAALREESDDGEGEEAPPEDVDALREQLGERLRALSIARADAMRANFQQAAE
jgi:hypothetical protein